MFGEMYALVLAGNGVCVCVSPLQSKHNMSAPSWVTAEVMENLRKLKDFGFQIMFGVYKQQEKSRLNGGRRGMEG